MKIYCLSQDDAVNTVKGLNTETAIISITNKLSRDVVFSPNDHVHSILRLKFDDELLSKGFGPRLEDFAGLKNFIDSLNDIENLIIHCGAGESRSPAVAMAVAQYIEKNGGKAVICSEIDDYNSLVFKLARLELQLYDENDPIDERLLYKVTKDILEKHLAAFKALACDSSTENE